MGNKIKRQLPSILAALAILGAAILSGCASHPVAHEPGIANAKAWQQHQQKVEKLTQWSLQGRASVSHRLGRSANISWRQKHDYFDIRLSGPLGMGGFRAQGTPEQVKIRTKREQVETRHPQALIESQLGWPFPIEAMRYWAIGLPAPGGYQSISVNNKGQLVEIEQQGWKLRYADYGQTKEGLSLPRKLYLDGHNTKIEIVVSRWFNLSFK